jgi:hypothetical protein
MAYDEKQFLALLEVHKSDETKKARRNASTIAFVVLAAWLLHIRLADVKVLGVDISKTSEIWVLLIALVLLGYWTGMFVLAWMHDKEIQKERTVFLDKELETIRARVKYGAESQGKVRGYVPMDYAEMSAALEVYEKQKARTMRAAFYGTSIKKLEIVVPLTLSVAATMVLLIGMAMAL